VITKTPRERPTALWTGTGTAATVTGRAAGTGAAATGGLGDGVTLGSTTGWGLTAGLGTGWGATVGVTDRCREAIKE
jgi:hypothetical protein